MISLGFFLIVLAIVGVMADMIFDFDMFMVNLIAGAGIAGCLLFILGILAHG